VTEPTSELLVFEVGARAFAAPVEDAVRVGAARQLTDGELVLETALGRASGRARGIVVAGDGSRTLVVDRVLGVRSVPSAELHPIPAFAAACLSSRAVRAFVLVEGEPLLVVDLPTLVREPAGPAHADPCSQRC
jgi:hypothetical protein